MNRHGYWGNRFRKPAATSECSSEEQELTLIRDAKQFILTMLDGEPSDPTLRRAWDQFYDLYTGTIRRFVISQGVSGSDVDDCVQDVWLYIIRKMSDFHCPARRSGFRCWLYRIVSSVSVDLFRERAKRPGHLAEGQKVNGGNGVANQYTNDSQLLEWRRSMVATLLNKIRTRISPINYRLIEMRFLDGKSVTEVAEALGMTNRQVWYRQHRVVARLRDLSTIYTGGMFRPSDAVDAW